MIISIDGKKVTNGIPDILSCIGLEIGKSLGMVIKPNYLSFAMTFCAWCSLVFEIKRKPGVDKIITVTTAPEHGKKQK